MTFTIRRGCGVYRGFALVEDGADPALPWLWRDEIDPSPRRQGRARTAADARQAVDLFIYEEIL